MRQLLCVEVSDTGTRAPASLPIGLAALSALETLRAFDEACDVCGCTDNFACPGGCHWAADGLCSACIAADEPAIAGIGPSAMHRLQLIGGGS